MNMMLGEATAPLECAETHKTPQTPFSKTLTVSNQEFLLAIFEGIENIERPYVVGTAPEAVGRDDGFGSGQYWNPSDSTEDSMLNWYYTLSTYRKKGSQYQRRKDQFHRAFGIYFDDVGTKSAPLAALDNCPPSYVIETSPGNFQAGYLFDRPCEDFREMEVLIKAAATKEFTDKGAGGPATRLGRLPNGVNGKHTPYFCCRLTSWNPERRYSIAEIMSRLDLTVAEHGEVQPSKASIGHSMASLPAFSNSVYSPKPKEHPVVTACKAHGMYKCSPEAGKHEISCPWVAQHSGLIDSGTVYYEPSEGYQYGAFKCQHGHCADRKLSEFLESIQVSLMQARHRATICPISGEFDAVVDAAEAELAALGGYYQRGGVICNIVTDPSNKNAVIRSVNISDLTRSLSKSVAWVIQSPTGGKLVDPSFKHVKALLGSGTYKHLPSLLGITRQPYLRPDGSLMSIAGYDEATMMFGQFEASNFSVPDQPSIEQAHSALNELKLLLSEFEFKDNSDLSSALGMILTSAVRPSLPLCPMGHIKAHQIASGKSYLCDLIAAFSGPANASAYAFPTNDEECSKLLLSAFFSSPPVIKFDNLTSDLLPFKSLCSAITEPFLTGRVLGASQMRTVATRSLILSSGNNVDPIADMVRRVVTIHLDPNVETPATRRFSKDPLQEVLQNRERYVSLALTIIRAFVVSGSPKQAGLTPLTSFDEWTKWVRSPLVWLGISDPAASMFESMANDPDREMLGRLLKSWNEVFGGKPVSVSDLVKSFEAKVFSGQTSDLVESLREVGEQQGRINRRRLGRWISRHQGQLVDGLKLARGTKQSGSERWIVH